MTENAVIPAPDAGALTLPNAITLAGAGLTAWWLRGGPAWAAVAGLLADEVDGRLARATILGLAAGVMITGMFGFNSPLLFLPLGTGVGLAVESTVVLLERRHLVAA